MSGQNFQTMAHPGQGPQNQGMQMPAGGALQNALMQHMNMNPGVGTMARPPMQPGMPMPNFNPVTSQAPAMPVPTGMQPMGPGQGGLSQGMFNPMGRMQAR